MEVDFIFSGRQLVIAAVTCAVVAVLFTAEGELTQSLEEPCNADYFPQPYFLTWFAISCYSLWLPLWFLISLVRHVTVKDESVLAQELGDLGQAGTAAPETGASARKVMEWTRLWNENKRTCMAACVLSPIYLLNGYLYFESLPRTAYSANTIIYNSQSVVVYGLSLFLLRESASLVKMASIVISLAGIVCVALSGSEDGGKAGSVFGYVLVITSTVFGALFNVLCKRMLDVKVSEQRSSFTAERDPSSVPAVANCRKTERDYLGSVLDSLLFMGCLGLFSCIMYWPGLVILDWLGNELFVWPSWSQFGLIMINSAFDSSADFLSVLGIVFTSPLLMSVGALLSIPAAIVADVILHDYTLDALQWIGLFLVVAGFGTIILAYFFQVLDKENETTRCTTCVRVKTLPAVSWICKEYHCTTRCC